MKDAKGVISYLKTQGVEYADIRLHLIDKSERISTLNSTVDQYSNSENAGFGIRVLFAGAWGFATSEDFSEMEAVANRALTNAKISSRLVKDKIILAPKKICHDIYHRSVEVDPFSLSAEEKIARLMDLDKRLAHNKFSFWGVSVRFYTRRILFLDTDGSEIERNLIDVDGDMFILFNDVDGIQQRRTHTLSQKYNGTTGFENILNEEQFGPTATLVLQAQQLINAPICQERVCDVILLNEMMALQTHETIGHALELDRILGYELSYAGGSHINLEHFGNLPFASEKLTARADGTVPNSPGSTGFDDDGVSGQNVPLIEKGVLVGAITSRQMVTEANRKADREIFSQSGGACRAESYKKMPIERMNNINIDFGSDGTLEDIIKKTENGIILETPKSWSIGSNRQNFHFATEIAWKVVDGKKTEVLRNATYGDESLKFWHSLDQVGDASTWNLMTTFMCGKGQPNQVMRIGHGVPICRFKNVKVGW